MNNKLNTYIIPVLISGLLTINVTVLIHLDLTIREQGRILQELAIKVAKLEVK